MSEAVQRDMEAVILAAPWSARRVLSLLNVSEASYYRRKQRRVWQHGGGRRPVDVASVTAILETARRHTEYGYRQVAAALRWEHPDIRVSASTVYRVLRQHGLLGRPIARHTPSKRAWVRFERSRPNELWQVDVSYWYIEGWGFYYLHTVLDDHSRFVITSQLLRTYGAEDGVRMLQTALAAVPAAERQGLEILVDHGVTYTAESFQATCKESSVHLIFASVRHPQTKGKLERWHRTIRAALEDRLRNAPTPQEAQRMIDKWVKHYNDERPHQACDGYPPASRYRSEFQLLA